MKFLRVFFISFILATTLSAEQSVYSDSDFIDADAVAKKNSQEIFILKQQISQLKEQIEGLKSIINGQANTIEQIKAKTNNNLEDIVNQLSQRVATLESKSAQVVVKNRDTNSNQMQVESPKPKVMKKEKNLSNKELYKLAVLNFTNGKLSKAKEGFETLKKRAYKKASVNFYLGEIAFKKQKYNDAIINYQKSVNLKDKASYMDKLLLHTAISLQKMGKKSEAKNFFDAVIMGYPDTISAKEAKKYIK